MIAFLTRYEQDPSRPTFRLAVRDLVVRAVLPAAGVFVVLVGIGWLILGPLGGLPDEDLVNVGLQQRRSAAWDAVTRVWSMLGNTEVIIATCLLVVVLVWWRTRQWWVAVIPGIAISVQASVFVACSAVTGRDRPQVEQLDPAPPTSGYPSGHVGAATALYLTFAMLAHRITRRWVRRLVLAGCLLVPLLVGFARLYRGMHHPTDVVVGIGNGVVCGVLAWGYLRRDARDPAPSGLGSDPRVAGAGEGVEGVRGEPERDDQQQHGALGQPGQ